MSDSKSKAADASASEESEHDPSAGSTDRFDLAGREIAELLRTSNEAAQRTQLEAERLSRALRERARVEAEAAAAARLAAADRQAADIRLEATRHLEAAELTRAQADAWSNQVTDTRAEAARMLDEVLSHLDRAVEEIGRLEDRAMATRAALRDARDIIAPPLDEEAGIRTLSGASSPTPEQASIDVNEPPTPAEHANGHGSMMAPPTTAAGLGVTDAVRSAVQKAVAQRRTTDDRPA